MATEKNISGIAMNERLNDAGLLDDFYQAANKKDRNTMIDLLVSIEIERSQAEETADAILNNRAFDGS
jgi:hypothetical protein